MKENRPKISVLQRHIALVRNIFYLLVNASPFVSFLERSLSQNRSFYKIAKRTEGQVDTARLEQTLNMPILAGQVCVLPSER